MMDGQVGCVAMMMEEEEGRGFKTVGRGQETEEVEQADQQRQCCVVGAAAVVIRGRKGTGPALSPAKDDD